MPRRWQQNFESVPVESQLPVRHGPYYPWVTVTITVTLYDNNASEWLCGTSVRLVRAIRVSWVISTNVLYIIWRFISTKLHAQNNSSLCISISVYEHFNVRSNLRWATKPWIVTPSLVSHTGEDSMRAEQQARRRPLPAPFGADNDTWIKHHTMVM